ncbi:MAG: diguanylate cyclase [Thiotrichales bacterium]
MNALRLSPSISVTLGLVSLTVLLFWMLDFAVGIVPDEQRTQRLVREQLSTQLALQLGVLLDRDDNATLNKTLTQIQQHNQDILSIGIRRTNGEIIAQSAMHWRFWIPPPQGKSTLDHLQVPILANHTPWAYVEISYQPSNPGGPLGGLIGPSLTVPLSIVVGGFLFFYLYLRRVLQHLDPTQVIPERVSAALDTLTEGVMIIDSTQRILLVNAAFRRLDPAAARVVIGQKIAALHWLMASVQTIENTLPWRIVLNGEDARAPEAIDLPGGPDGVRRVMISAAPVRDGQAKLRGCLVIFRDVTELERTTAKLRQALIQIEAQNSELQRLANHDQLTNLLNRRAFFERGTAAVKEALKTRQPLTCIMCDIDHFKSINDTHGHPVGDEAIKVVAKLLLGSVRPNDIVARYGGEEFCILLLGIPSALGTQVGERIRSQIETQAGLGVRSVQGLRITSSFGLTTLELGAANLEDLIGQADEALYQSKKGGRNRVTMYAHPTSATGTDG